MLRFLFALSLFFSLAGSRLGEGGLDGGIFRSIHVVDFLTPLIAVAIFREKTAIKRCLGQNAFITLHVWLLYCFTAGILSSLLWLDWVGQEGGYALVAPLFALKEMEFILLLGLAVAVGFFNYFFYIRVVIVFSCFAVLWMAKEFILPTGYYFIGLPFEGGAAQTGLAYAFLALNLYYVLENPSFASRNWFPKNAFFYSLILLLIMGSLSSLSRTTGLALAAACILLFILRITYSPSIKTVSRIFAFVSMCIFFIMLFIDADTLDIIFGRWFEFESAAGDRSEKWFQLFSYQLHNSGSLFFGFGFNSPNPLVLGSDLGNVLAVDNGYVRRLFELGFVGVALFIFALSSLALRSLRCGGVKYFSAALTLLLFSAFTIESFQVSQIASLFYLTAGVIIGRGFYSRFVRSFYCSTLSGKSP